jgi:outer membrane protein TolC
MNQVFQFLSHCGVAFLFVYVLAGQAGLPVPDVPDLQAAGSARRRWPQRRRLAAVLASVVLLFVAVGASAQATSGGSSSVSSLISGSVPTGVATGEVMQLTLRDSINMALRYNLGAVESGESSRSARGQRLLALSHLLPQVSASAQENVSQYSMATLGLKLPSISGVVGPYSYTTAGLSASQSLFSLESVQRLRAARTAEQAAQLDYKDTLDVVTLTVGNSYLQVLQPRALRRKKLRCATPKRSMIRL